MGIRRVFTILIMALISVIPSSCGDDGEVLTGTIATMQFVIYPYYLTLSPEEIARRQNIPLHEAIELKIEVHCESEANIKLTHCLESGRAFYRVKYPQLKLGVSVEDDKLTIQNLGTTGSSFRDQSPRRHIASFTVGPDIDREVFLVEVETEGLKEFVAPQSNYLFVGALTKEVPDTAASSE